MSHEGEGGPAAPYSWRLRLSAGLLFALAASGVLLTTAGPAAARTQPEAEIYLPFRAAESSAGLLVEAGALALLGRAALRRRPGRPQAAVDPAPPPWLPPKPEPAAASSLPGPGAARELLALFRLPRPEENAEHEPEAATATVPVAEAAMPLPEAEASDPRPLIHLYGPLTIDGNESSALRQRAVRGLIAFLALRQGPASFEELGEALWPDEHAAVARDRVQKAKQTAQLALGGALGRGAGCYQLERGKVRVDVAEIERLDGPDAGRDRLERALALARGEPLANVDYPFAEGERRRLRSLRIDLLARVSRARRLEGQARAALAAAEELIALDRLNEIGWRLAMEADAALGARQAIIDRYDELNLYLDSTLGLEPQRETRATYRRLLGQH